MRSGPAALTALLFLLASGIAWSQPKDVAATYDWSTDPIASVLESSNVLVGKSYESRVDKKKLEDLAAHAPKSRPLKIVAANGLPSKARVFKSGTAYLAALQKRLNLKRGILFYTSDAGSIAFSNVIDRADVVRVVSANSSLLKRDPTAGIVKCVGILDEFASGRRPPLPPPDPYRPSQLGKGAGMAMPPFQFGLMIALWLMTIVVFFLILLILLFWLRSSWTQSKLSGRLPVQREHAEVVTLLAFVEAYLDLLPESEEHSSARQSRRVAGALLEEAKPFARKARGPQDYRRATALLDQARERAKQARESIRTATGGTDFAIAVKELELRVSPKTESGVKVNVREAPVAEIEDIDAIPENERAACFFCARPARVAEMTPVTFAANGERRIALTCMADIESLRRGAVPMIRIVGEPSARVPWFRTAFDPFRDYDGSLAVYAAPFPTTGDVPGVALSTFLFDPSPFNYPILVAPGGGPTTDSQAVYAVVIAEPAADIAEFFGLTDAKAHRAAVAPVASA